MLTGWIAQLFMGQGIAHTMFILAIVVFAGVMLGKMKIGGISLGVTWVLFVGIILSHFGMRLDPATLGFIKDFGLILFVYSIGLSVGPNFFSSFKKGGMSLNIYATILILLTCLCTFVIHKLSGTSLITMIGVMQGAVTNTPGLGAAQQTVADANGGVTDPSLALGYAVAYPLGVLGIIFSIIFVKKIFGVKIEKETEKLNSDSSSVMKSPKHISIEIIGGASGCGKSIAQIGATTKEKFIVSRICKSDGSVVIPNPQSALKEGDRMLVTVSAGDADAVVAALGKVVKMDMAEWDKMDNKLVSRKILVTKHEVDDKSLVQLNVRGLYGVNVTRIIRSGVSLVALPNMRLQIGDTLIVVGNDDNIKQLAGIMGDSVKRLWQPNLAAIFFGIALGVLLGSIPFKFPGMPQAVKLGLAGGPLIMAILIGYFCHRLHIITYTTESANLMLRELGITLFLAAVGLGAGEGFVDTIVNHQGYLLIGYGVIITLVPLLIVAICARWFSKINYLTLMGMMAGSTTDPPALAFANEMAGNSYPGIGYATVYPLTMFLRVLCAQIMVLIAL